MAKKRKPLAKFRIYGYKSTLYFHVYIWPLLKDIRREYEKNKSNEASSRGTMAFVRPTPRYNVHKDGRYKIKPVVGEIHLCVKELGTEVITHESTHAAAALLRRLNFSFSKLSYSDDYNYMKYEELMAYVVGQFARQIVAKVYKLKFLVEAKKG